MPTAKWHIHTNRREALNSAQLAGLRCRMPFGADHESSLLLCYLTNPLITSPDHPWLL